MHEECFDLVDELGWQLAGDEFGGHPFDGFGLEAFLFLSGQCCFQDVGRCPAEDAFATAMKIEWRVMHGQQQCGAFNC